MLDIGGGPVSLLLKTTGGGTLTVVDPCPFPRWVARRYREHGVDLIQATAEDYRPPHRYDEVWVYNVLQHVSDPEAVIATAREAGDRLRIFEWTGIPPDEMHPHVLEPEELGRWCGCEGQRAFGVNMAWGERPAWAWYAVYETSASAATISQ